MARKCIFCGDDESAMTREHVVAKWISELVRPPKGGFLMHNEYPHLRREWTQKTHFIELVAKCVCEACNSGWMSALEVEVARFLTPLIEGGDIVLDQRDQELLSIWAIKTAMVLEETADQATARYYVPEERTGLAEAGSIPGITQIWLARRETTNRRVFAGARYCRVPDDSPQSSPAYVANIFVGQLCLQTVSARVPLVTADVEIEFVAADGWHEHTVRIWPVAEEVQWEDMPAITEAQADALADRWDAATGDGTMA